jgi:hypothetical protein
VADMSNAYRSAAIPKQKPWKSGKFFCGLLLFAGVCLHAAEFPSITSESLAGKKVELPGAITGKVAVLCIGFTHSSQTEVKQWTSSLRSRFAKNPNVAVYSIAVLEDAPRLVRGMILHGMKGSVPATEYDKFLVLYKNESELKQAVGFGSGNDGYVVVLDKSGNIRVNKHGDANPAAVDELISEIGALVPSSVR